MFVWKCHGTVCVGESCSSLMRKPGRSAWRGIPAFPLAALTVTALLMTGAPALGQGAPVAYRVVGDAIPVSLTGGPGDALAPAKDGNRHRTTRSTVERITPRLAGVDCGSAG